MAASSAAFNLGNGNGFSVLEVIRAVELVTQRKLNVVDAPRREGDPARLVADSRLIRQTLGWAPAYAQLETIVAHGWGWERSGRSVGEPSRMILITGGAGFIGSHTVDLLVAQGQRVRVLDDFSSGRRENLPASTLLEIVEGDVRDPGVVGARCRG